MLNKEPLFSIIVPIYNVQKYLEVCIKSVIEQSFPEFELILVDDGSQDLCPLICDKYSEKDNRITVIHKKNGGLVSARKAGARLATGEYVICLDGDDWLERDCLLIYKETIDRYHPDIICSSYAYSSNENERGKIVEIPYEQGMYERDKIETTIFPILIQTAQATYFRPQLWSKCFRRSNYVQEQLKVDDNIVLGEDGACTIPCIYNADKIYVEKRVTYRYRVAGDSITSSKKAFNWNGPRLIHLHLSERVNIEKFDFQNQLYRKTAHEIFSVVMSQFNRNEPYFVIKKDIENNLNDDIYSDAIKKCHFYGNKKAVIMQYLLKYRLFFVMKILANWIKG